MIVPDETLEALAWGDGASETFTPKEAQLVALELRAYRRNSAAADAARLAKDRSAVLRMAGNIASGICADSTGPVYHASDAPDVIQRTIAQASVQIARAIIAETDKPAPHVTQTNTSKPTKDQP